MRRLAIFAVIVTAAGAGMLLSRTGGADAIPPNFPPIRGNFDLTKAQAFQDFPLYGLGTDFEQLPLTAVLRKTGNGAEALPVRLNFVSFIYGDCLPTGGSGCAPPLEVQVWPACERNPSVYDWTPSEEAAIEHLTIRGVPAAFYEDGKRLEISTGHSTVIIFGSDREQLLRAAQTLQGVNTGHGPGDDLPAPAAGAVDGLLTCA